jgi:hypothetical protein
VVHLGRHRDLCSLERHPRRPTGRGADGPAAILVAYIIAFQVIHATPALALGLAAALLVLDVLGWPLVSALFDRERLITGTK